MTRSGITADRDAWRAGVTRPDSEQVTQAADAAAWQAWPESYDWSERDAFRSGYMTALQSAALYAPEQVTQRRDWSKVNPKAVAEECSPAHIIYLIADALADIRDLQARHRQSAAAIAGEVDLLAEFEKWTTWELSCDCWDTGDWQVYDVRGARSDREWHLVSSGETPAEAITRALALAKARGGAA